MINRKSSCLKLLVATADLLKNVSILDCFSQQRARVVNEEGSGIFCIVYKIYAIFLLFPHLLSV